MEPASDVVSERVNSRGELVQKLTTGQERTVQLKRVASVPVSPAKKADTTEPASDAAGTAGAAGAGAVAGAAATAAALGKKKNDLISFAGICLAEWRTRRLGSPKNYRRTDYFETGRTGDNGNRDNPKTRIKVR